MALIITGKTACAICNVAVQANDTVVSTSHFIADCNNHLWRFSDAAMHQACFLTWEHRLAFINLFNETAGKNTFGNGNYHFMQDDGTTKILNRGDR
ncbi:MAG TPA: hypothetical protein VFC63_09380 [Blastocatellia bacterium]|nr:hypothetical protein [Blastocatellia bacterium]